MDRGLNHSPGGLMATVLAGQEGMLSLGNPDVAASPWQNSIHEFNPTSYNQTYVAYYKMQGKNSTGWDSWTNNTGDETGRPVSAGQEAATIVASWFIPQGF